MEDFEISIKIAVYTTDGKFIRQLGNASLSDETMALVMKDVAIEVNNAQRLVVLLYSRLFRVYNI